MTIELLQTLSTSAFIGAAVFFLAAVALFFLFDIPKVFGEITGSTAKKAIEDIRQQNERTGDKAYKPSAVNAERGKLTDKITPSGRLLKKEGHAKVAISTAKLKTAEIQQKQQGGGASAGGAETTVLANQSQETTVLMNQSQETTVLMNQPQNGTELSKQTPETTLLYGQQPGAPLNYGQPQETTILVSDQNGSGDSPKTPSKAKADNAYDFSIDYDIYFLGSSEIIT